MLSCYYNAILYISSKMRIIFKIAAHICLCTLIVCFTKTALVNRQAEVLRMGKEYNITSSKPIPSLNGDLPNITLSSKPLNISQIYYEENTGHFLKYYFSIKIKIELITGKNFTGNYLKNCQNVTFGLNWNNLDLCPCVPDTIEGRKKIDVKVAKIQTESEIIQNNKGVQPGGYWKPADCYSRDRVAIVIPFRDRLSHLNILLKYLHPLLQRQQVEYRIFVVEQSKPATFNKASLMNAGFLQIKQFFNFDCVVFHDVDLIPEDDRNFYTCMNSPRHVAPYVNKFNYNMMYPILLGGALLFKPEEFRQVNGYSNHFYGWGGEDDDMTIRFHFHNMTVYRSPATVARYTMISHGRDKGNSNNNKRIDLLFRSVFHPEESRTDGLNTLKYNVVDWKMKPLYTWIQIELPDVVYIKNKINVTHVSKTRL